MTLRSDQLFSASLVSHGARVLEIGCADGSLLEYLRDNRQTKGFGLEVDPVCVSSAIAKGFSIVQGDADTDLSFYPDNHVDVVILSQTLQHLRSPGDVFRHLLRIGHSAIVSFANFGHWATLLLMVKNGRMPQVGTVPSSWDQSHGPRMFTLTDFRDFCDRHGYVIRRSRLLDRQGRALSDKLKGRWACLSCSSAVVQVVRP